MDFTLNDFTSNVTNADCFTSSTQFLACDHEDHLNRVYSQTMKPVIAFMTMLMMMGTAGNFIVMFVLFMKKNKTVADWFITLLATLDFTSSLVIHPYVIYKLLHFYGPNLETCKIFEFFIHLSLSIQLNLLWSVAIDRYYAVCHPLKFHTSYRRAIVLVILSFGGGLGMSLPLLVFYGKRTMTFNEGQCSVMTCHYSDEYDGTRSHSIFGAFVIFAMIALLTCIAVLYVKVAKTAYQRHRTVSPRQAESLEFETGTAQRSQTRNRGQETSALGSVDQGMTRKYGVPGGTAQPTREIFVVTNAFPHPSCSTAVPSSKAPSALVNSPKNNELDQQIRQETKNKRKEARRVMSGLKAAKILFLVTAIFILSWIPFWILKIGEIISPERWTEQSGSALFGFLNHLFYMNNAVNPFIYAFLHKKFRSDCRQFWKKSSCNKNHA